MGISPSRRKAAIGENFFAKVSQLSHTGFKRAGISITTRLVCSRGFAPSFKILVVLETLN